MSVTTARDDREVATVTVARAGKLNVLDPPTAEALIAAFAALSVPPVPRVVILRGDGERAMIGGADIEAMAGLTPATARGFITLIHRCCAALRACPAPVIARCAGYTLGAGLEIAASADLRIAATDAKFGMPETRIGIPSVVEAALLPGLIGWGRTRRLLLTGEIIDAARAEAWGLVEATAAPEALDAALEALVAALLAAGPNALRIQKRLIQDWEQLAPDPAVQRGVDAFVEAWESPEPAAMMGAFLAARRRRKAAGG
ncbi:MAG: enoyl-CoA hydratase [Acetobacteraceae bacterium]